MKTLAAIFFLLCAGGFARAELPWIGIELERGAHGGTRIKHVLPATPAERAGLQEGDEVLSVDGAPAASARALIESVQRAGVGHQARLRVLDARGKSREVTLTLEAKPSMTGLQRSALLGKPAPDFAPSVQAGAKLGPISSLRGKVVLIDFFATWCGPCVEAMQHIEEMHQRLGPRGLTVLGVSTESAAIVAAAEARFRVSYPLASDGDEAVSGRYHVFALPTLVVIDRRGVVREVAVADTDRVDRAVAEALAQRGE